MYYLSSYSFGLLLLILNGINIVLHINPCSSQSSVCNLARNADCNNNGNSPDNPGCNVCNNNVCGQCSGQSNPNGFFKVSNHLDYCIPCSNIIGCAQCADNNGCQQCIDTLIQPTDIYNCSIKICYPDDNNTPDPSPSPTDDPSNAPTEAPSDSPTIAPSNAPTSAPVELTPEEIFTEIFESLFETLNPTFPAYREDALLIMPFGIGGLDIFRIYYANICDISVHSVRKEFLLNYDGNGTATSLSYNFYNSCHSSINGFFWINGRNSVEYDENGLIKRMIAFYFEETDLDYILEYGQTRIDNGLV